MAGSWQQYFDQAVTLRHKLHKNPELGWQEFTTAQLIRDELDRLQIPWRVCAELGTLATINASSSNQKHIALRADMDALAIHEQTDKDWQSLRAGHMHACGHDGHTATLLATAALLKSVEASLPCKVTLLFQPAEEGGHGAHKMIEDGALDGIDFIYGWHNWPVIPFGQLACPDQIVMCGNGTFEIHVKGQGGHASQPEKCRDPVIAASAINLALQQAVSRAFPPQQPVVLSVTSIDARSGPTVIPDKALLSGSIRVPDEACREQLNKLIVHISQQTASAYGVACEVKIFPRYQATINHPAAAQSMRECWQADQGKQGIATSVLLPVMASEDFSYYLQQIPGAFALIGSDDGLPEHQAVCHSPHYDFNDRLIPLVSRLFMRLVGAPLKE